MKALIEQTLSLFPEYIDISDGEALEDNGFWSKNLSGAWYGAEDKNGDDTNDVSYMIWAIYRLLHRKSRASYLQGVYTVHLDSFSFQEIEREYDKVMAEVDASD